MHDLTQKSENLLLLHETFVIALLSRTSSHRQPNDQLHSTYKQQLHRRVRQKVGRSCDILDAQLDDEDEDRTAVGNLLRGRDMEVITDAAGSVLYAMESKLFLAAWLVTGNLTLEDAHRCLVQMSATPETATKDALCAACPGFEAQNVDARQQARGDGRFATSSLRVPPGGVLKLCYCVAPCSTDPIAIGWPPCSKAGTPPSPPQRRSLWSLAAFASSTSISRPRVDPQCCFYNVQLRQRLDLRCPLATCSVSTFASRQCLR